MSGLPCGTPATSTCATDAMEAELFSRLRRAALTRLLPKCRVGEEVIANVAGFFTEGDILAYRALAREAKRPAVVVEIGSWKGRSAINLALGCDVELIAVDTFLGSQFEQAGAHREAVGRALGVYPRFLRNVLRARVAVSVLRLDSLRAARILNDAIADLVFIDAGHTYDEVVSDIRAWIPKVKAGGVLAGHDYHGDNTDVARAVLKCLPGRQVRRFPGSSVWAVNA